MKSLKTPIGNRTRDITRVVQCLHQLRYRLPRQIRRNGQIRLAVCACIMFYSEQRSAPVLVPSNSVRHRDKQRIYVHIPMGRECNAGCSLCAWVIRQGFCEDSR
jgi:hypothetical protein